MQKKNIKKKVILFLSVFILFVSISMLIQYSNTTLARGTQSFKFDKNIKSADIVWTYNLTGSWTITIDGNSLYNNWSDLVGIYDWLTGSGTEENPYEIKGILFDGQNQDKNLIHIKNSNAHFRIRDCILYNTYYYDYDESSCNAILIESSQNGKISNVNVSECQNGIRLYNCQNIRIEGNYANANSQNGIKLNGGSSNRISNNTITGSQGVYLDNSDNNDVTNNIISELGEVSYYYYYYYDYYEGIYLYNSNYNNITDNKISDYYLNYGMGLSQSSYNNISKNLIQDNVKGMGIISHSNYNTIVENTIFNSTTWWWEELNQSHGIYVFSCSWNTINQNFIYNNTGDGIFVENSDNHTISANILMYNGVDDIYLKETPSVDLSLNEMHGHGLFFDISTPLLGDINIESSNTVNSKPIYFYFNKTGLDQFDLFNAGQIFLYYCNETEMESFDFSDASAGITLKYCNDNTINIVGISDNIRWGLYLFECNDNHISNVEAIRSRILLKDSNYNDFQDNLASYSKTSGFSFENCNHSTISDNFATYNHDDGIQLNSNNHVLLNNNSANFNGGNGLSLYGLGAEWIYNGTDWNIYTYTCINNTILSGDFNNNNQSGMSLRQVDNTFISDNNIHDNVYEVDSDYFHDKVHYEAGLYVEKFENCTIHENSILRNKYGISLNQGINAIVTNNSILSNIDMYEDSGYIRGGAGITTSEVSESSFFGNLVNKNAIGFEIISTTGCIIENNKIQDNKDEILSIFNPDLPVDTGVFVKSSTGITIKLNYMKNNGIGFEGSNYNLILFNEITWTGIILTSSNNNTISGNKITRGLIGIDLHSSSYNNITNNTILSQQCFRETGECIGNIFENNSCKEELPPNYFREIMSLIGLASVAGVSIPLYVKTRKSR